MSAHRRAAVLASCLIAGLASAAALAAPAERELNAWPIVVRQHDEAGRVPATTAAGPFVFEQPSARGGTIAGLRPVWLQRHNEQGDFRSAHFLYPLFSYHTDGEVYRWSVFQLIRRWGRRAGAPAPTSEFDQRHEFEVFPFWFSRQAGDPALSYRGLFPVWGTVKNKLGFERLTWRLFPLYVENEKRGAVTTSTPWPIIRRTTGAAQGFGVWPLFNIVERPGESRQAHYLWPLGYHVLRQPPADAPAGTPPREDIGALPFYARSTGPGYYNVSYGWPFFGYTDRTEPARYRETRYFWPFLVQGRGDQRYVNRWGPFYTHSIIKGYDKKWYGWPLVRRAQWEEEGLLRTKTQFLYFVYWSQRQESIARPNLPAAQLTHVWPLWSTWDNGAGRQQWQFFSPFDVFFPRNEEVRVGWTPFFAIARRDRQANGDSRTSLLWNAVTWAERPRASQREVHLGPLFSSMRDATSRRIAIGNGLFGFQRHAGQGWRVFWLDFPANPTEASSGSR